MGRLVVEDLQKLRRGTVLVVAFKMHLGPWGELYL